MKYTPIFLLAFSWTFALHSYSQAKSDYKKPNIIFIFADDLGYGDIGCYGQQKIETPKIDLFAKSGKQFTQFYSGSSVCAPARSSFLTGQHTGHTPVRGNKQFAPEGQTPLPDSVVTLANLLQQSGYATAAFGKWGLGFNQNSGDPGKKGFDRFYGYNCQSLAHDYYPPYIWDNYKKVEFPENKLADSIYAAAKIQGEAVRYISEAQNQPFFMFLSYTLPHGDVIGPDDSLYRHYVKKFGEAPLTGADLKTRPHNKKAEPYPHAQFAAMVSRLDMYVGEIIAALTKKGLLENTVVMFSSDNGPHRENGGDPEFFNSNGRFRGIKRDLYEGGIRVPFIVSWPGRIKPSVTGKVGALWDLHPTFLDLAGHKAKTNTDGISLLPALLNQKAEPAHKFLYWEFHENEGRQAVRWKNWKMVRLKVNSQANMITELYNLDQDIEENYNVISKYPAIATQMLSMMNDAHVYNPDWPLLPAEFK